MGERRDDTFANMLSDLLLSKRLRTRSLEALGCLALCVVLGVGLALRRNGITMTHQETVLDCQYAGNGAHTHDASCYDEQGYLVCTLQERQLHFHTQDCYATEQVLACQIAEGEGAHHHTDECYDEEGNLICGLVESEGHVHTEACYQTVTTDQVICGQEEVTEEHVHGPSCFKTITVDDGEPEPEPEPEPAPAPEPEPEPAPAPEPEPQPVQPADPVPAQDDPQQPVTPTPAPVPVDVNPAPVPTVDPTPTPTVDDTTPEDPMPEQKFADVLKDSYGDVVLALKVTAPRGSLPAGAMMRIYPVDTNDGFMDKVEDVIRKESNDKLRIKQLMPVDIRFYDPQGNQIDPVRKVQVKICVGFVPVAESDPVIIHVIDRARTRRTGLVDDAELIPAARVNWDDEDRTVGHEDTMWFEADEFSPYVVAELEPVPEEPAEDEAQPKDEEEPEDEAKSEDTEGKEEADAEADPKARDDQVDPEPTDEAEPSYPAQTFEHRVLDRSDNLILKVSVAAPEGSFPEGTAMQARWLDASEFEGVVADAVAPHTDGVVAKLQAIDITFVDADGNEVEPLLPIAVTFTSDLISSDEDAFIVHVDDAGVGEVMDAQASDAANELVVDADSFSTYVVAITTLHKVLTASDGSTYDITVDSPAEAGIPQDSELQVSEVLPGTSEYDAYLEQALEAMGPRDERCSNVARFFDIKIMQGGLEVQPQATVHVDVRLTDAPSPDDSSSSAVHFTDEATPVLLASTQDGDVTSFNASSFSVYGIVYTVDFHYEFNGKSCDFSMVGGDTASMREFILAINLLGEGATDDDAKEFVNNIVDVQFSDESLMRVVPVNENITAGGLKQKYDLEVEYAAGLSQAQIDEMDAKLYRSPDYALVSLKPFDTPETLTIVMDNGDQFVIQVADEQIQQNVIAADGETYQITVTYNQKAGIPDNATLAVKEVLAGTDEYTQYLQDAAQKLGVESDDVPFARFFDIKIMSGKKEVEPTGAVDVSIKLTDAPTEDDVTQKVVHFEDEAAEPRVMEAEKAEDDALRFTTDSFSVYGVITPFANPSGVNDLDGRTFTISRNNSRYMTTNISAGNDGINQFQKNSSSNVAAVWQFEATGTAGQYNIFTYVDGVKKYMNLNRANQNQAHAALGDYPQAFTVERNNNGTYRFSAVSNGTRYYLNEYGGQNGLGYAGWYQPDSNNDSLTLNFAQPLQNNQAYALVVKVEDKYYSVLYDGSLEEIQYDAETNTISTDYPLIWTYTRDGIGNNGFNLRLPVKGLSFNQQQLAGTFRYRTINPNYADGYRDQDQGGSWNNPGAIPTDTPLYYDSATHTIRTGNNNYIGVTSDDEGNLEIVGQQSSANAVEILFAQYGNVPPIDNSYPHSRHTVNHIDISISGSASIKIPLAYGDYYDEDGNKVFTATSADHMLNLDAGELDITDVDVKNARIYATKYAKDENGRNTSQKVEVPDAFYVTGYSDNAQAEGSTPQIRIEGSFKVADINNNEMYWNPANGQMVSGSQVNDNQNSQVRLENRIFYTVETTKSVTFPFVKNINGQDVQLYDSDGHALSITIPVTVSASFDYWDTKNECPAVHINYVVNADFTSDWYQGKITDSGATQSGMDFRLGGDVSAEGRIYALEITKLIVDEAGNIIHPDPTQQTIRNTFQIFENKNAPNKNNVANVNVESYQGQETPSLFAGYDNIHSKSVTIGSSGVGLVYDYDVTDAMYYITEDHDESSLPDAIVDTDGEEWTYKDTYILTEYVRRGNQYDDKVQYPDPMHYSATYNRDGSYAAIPEVLGSFTTLTGQQKTSEFVEFFVYNVYQKGAELEVEKVWDPSTQVDGQLPDNTEVTVELYYAKRKIADANGPVPEADIPDWPDKEDYVSTKTEPLFDASLVKELFLRADQDWKGLFEGLPETLTDANGNVYEVDYFAKETKVTISGKDVTSHYTAVAQKTEPDPGIAGYNDGKVTITNSVETLNASVKKVWDPQPDSGSVTVELRRYHMPLDDEKVGVSVSKLWDDDNDRDRVRPSSLTVTLSTGATVTLNDANNWTATVNDLPMVANDGKPINYTWSEPPVAGYTASPSIHSGAHTTLVNRHTPDTVDVTLVINWSDQNNPNGSRPENVLARLSDGETYLISGDSTAASWQKTVTVPRYNQGTPIQYSWTVDEAPQGYSVAGRTVSENTTTITLQPQTRYYTVRVTKDGPSGQDLPTMPQGTYAAGTSVTFSVRPRYTYGDTYTITGGPNGTVSFYDRAQNAGVSFTIPAIDRDYEIHITSNHNGTWYGDWLVYGLTGWSSPYRSASQVNSSASSLNTRALAAEPSRVTVTDANPNVTPPAGYVEDDSFSVVLTLNGSEGWEQEFPDSYPKTDIMGNPYYYYVVETAHTPAEYWIDSYSGDPLTDTGTVTITNKLKGQISIEKTFSGTVPQTDYASQMANLRFQVTGPNGYNQTYAYGQDDASRHATWSGGTLTITELTLGDYTVVESGDTFVDGENVPYIHTVTMTVGETTTTGNSGQVTATKTGEVIVVNNQYDEQTIDIPVNKTWAFASPSGIASTDGWPNGATVEVTVFKSIDGSEPVATEYTHTLDANNRSYTFTGLPKFEGDDLVEYTVKETSITGVDPDAITTSVEGGMTTGYTIHNTEKEAGLTIIKSFTGYELSDAEKGQITFTVTGEGLPEGGLTKTYAQFTEVEGTYKWVLTQEDGIRQGKTYTVTETNADFGHYTRTTTYVVNDGEEATAGATIQADVLVSSDTGMGSIVVNNHYEVPETQIEVTKQWNDSENNERTFEGTKTIEFTLYQQYGTNDPVVYTEYGNSGKGVIHYENGAWEVVAIGNLPQYVKDGEEWVEATYFVVEDEIDGVSTTYQLDAEAVDGAAGAATADGTITIVNTDEELELNILKLDADDMMDHAAELKKLNGAVFELYKLDPDDTNGGHDATAGDNGKIAEVTTGADGADDGTAKFTGLAAGYYEVHELTAPDGYNMTSDATFYIKVDTGSVVVIVKEEGKTPSQWQPMEADTDTFTFQAQSATATIGNPPGPILPESGGPGLLTTTLTGIAMMIVGAYMGFVSRRKARKEVA